MDARISIITLGVSNLEKAYDFYKNGLGFPTTRNPQDGIVFFKTQGVCLALYPYNELADDVGPSFRCKAPKFAGITLAHNVRTKHEVDEILERAKKAGAKVEKAAQDTSWGGYGGYFSDLDGYLWEIAFGAFEFKEDGTLIVT